MSRYWTLTLHPDGVVIDATWEEIVALDAAERERLWSAAAAWLQTTPPELDAYDCDGSVILRREA